MTDPPRTLAEIPGLTFRGELPDDAAEMFGGSLVYQLGGALMFVLPDPERYPEAARPGVELKNVALVIGECPHCGGLRPALVAPAGVEAVAFPRELHEADCPASAEKIARAHDEPDEGNTA